MNSEEYPEIYFEYVEPLDFSWLRLCDEEDLIRLGLLNESSSD